MAKSSKIINSSQQPFFVISLVIRQKRNPLEPSNNITSKQFSYQLRLSSKPVPQQTAVLLAPDQVPGHVDHHQESLPASRTSRHTSDGNLSTILLSPTLVTVMT